MSPLLQRLAGEMLRRYLDGEVSNNCHDWTWPAWFPQAERVSFVREMERRNHVNRTDYDAVHIETEESVAMYCADEYGPPDWWVARVLAQMLLEAG